MPGAVDFRTRAFAGVNVDASGRDLGRKVYWKLYVIENLIRVVVHSILTAQVGPNWWASSVSTDLQRQVTRFKSRYAKQPWHSPPGQHDIYYTFLSDLSEIIRAHSHLFLPLIPDIDQWMARIEQILLPRNIVGHMNWLSATDRQRIDVFYADLHALIKHLALTPGFSFVIP